jgi:carbonic anhydrase
MKDSIKNKTWINDLSAGLVVFFVALPLCLGIASASTGRPDLLFSGVLAGIIGGVIVGYFSGSQLGVSGPAAGLITIVFSGIEKLGSFESFLLAVVISGIIQYIAGYLKAGIIGHYFPSSVIKGMLAGIGITLILKQIPHILGFDKDIMGDEAFRQLDGQNTLSEIILAFNYFNIGAIIISFFSIFILQIMDLSFFRKIKIFQFLPASLFVVFFSIILNSIFQFINPTWVLTGEHLVQLPIINNLTEIKQLIIFPDFKSFKNIEVYEIAITLALVASLETLLSVEATDKLDPYKRNTPTNKELKAQGIGNIIAGLVGGLPITQVIVRSSANINSGGKTKKATIFHGAILLFSVILIPFILNKIPIAALASILLLVGYKLTNFSLIKNMFNLGMEQFLPFIITIIGVVGLDLLKGILLGMLVAIFYILKKNHKNSYHKSLSEENGIKTYYIKLSEEITFLNKGSILETLHHIQANSKIIIDASKSISIDFDVIESIQEFIIQTAPFKNIKVETIGFKLN